MHGVWCLFIYVTVLYLAAGDVEVVMMEGNFQHVHIKQEQADDGFNVSANVRMDSDSDDDDTADNEVKNEDDADFSLIDTESTMRYLRGYFCLLSHCCLVRKYPINILNF